MPLGRGGLPLFNVAYGVVVVAYIPNALSLGKAFRITSYIYSSTGAGSNRCSGPMLGRLAAHSMPVY